MVGSAAAYSIKQSELGRKRTAVSGFEMLQGANPINFHLVAPGI
jgi:hypothetical protein